MLYFGIVEGSGFIPLCIPCINSSFHFIFHLVLYDLGSSYQIIVTNGVPRWVPQIFGAFYYQESRISTMLCFSMQTGFALTLNNPTKSKRSKPPAKQICLRFSDSDGAEPVSKLVIRDIELSESASSCCFRWGFDYDVYY